MTTHLFILIPADTPTGPVKGAYALSNALIGQCKVTLVTIRPGCGANTWLDPRIDTICLADLASNAIEKYFHYRLLLREAGGRSNVASLSLCLSADCMNILCKKYALTLCSVRGNLFINYRHDYGCSGIVLAFFHLFSLRWMDRVVAMSQSMARQIRTYSGHKAVVIGNFIDEKRLNELAGIKNDCDPFVFVFVGSLSSRKQPRLLLKALRELKQKNITAYVEYVGTGPESRRINEDARTLGLVEFVRQHGFLSNPERVLINADALVLPSLSEGISRAALEALYLGIPCVLRNADGNLELVIDGTNGTVFTDELDLPQAMLRAAKISRLNKKRECLLPLDFRQYVAVKKYMKLMSVNNELP
jgi:glycosyltransferase involved in cell wall biosynthesis